MRLPPDPPIDREIATMSRIDALLRLAWNDGQVSRLTSAYGGFTMAANEVETTAGAYYAGMPAIVAIPALKQLINGVADSVEFSLSGLPSHLAEIADLEAGVAKGARINVGKVYWNADWQVHAVKWSWLGLGGKVGVRRSGGGISGGKVTPGTATITLEAGSFQIRRSGAELSYWSDAQHQRAHPGDRFFERVALLNTGRQKAWPNF